MADRAGRLEERERFGDLPEIRDHSDVLSPLKGLSRSGRWSRRCWGGWPRAAAKRTWAHYGTQFISSRFLETIGRRGITRRRTARYHPEGNTYIEQFHRSLKEEEVWTAENRSLEEARESIAGWIEEYNHDRP